MKKVEQVTLNKTDRARVMIRLMNFRRKTVKVKITKIKMNSLHSKQIRVNSKSLLPSLRGTVGERQ